MYAIKKAHVQFHVSHRFMSSSNTVTCRLKRCIDLLVKYLLVPTVSLRLSKTHSFRCKSFLVNHWDYVVCLEVKTCWSVTCWLSQAVTNFCPCNETWQPRCLLVSNLLTLWNAITEGQCLLVSNLLAVPREHVMNRYMQPKNTRAVPRSTSLHG